MIHEDEMESGNQPVGYRLAPGTRYRILNKVQPVLFTQLPLKVLRVSRGLQPVLDCLPEEGAVSLEKILSHTSRIDPGRVLGFLSDLVQKGFVEKRGLPACDDPPSVSLIVDSRVFPKDLKHCVRTLTALDYPMDRVEVFVMACGLNPEDAQEIARLPRFKIRDVPRDITAGACLNLGAKEATGEILAFIDSACVVRPLWLKELVPAFADPGLGAVGGMVDSYYEVGELDRYIKYRFDREIASGSKWSAEGRPIFHVPALNFLVRRGLFAELGGFKESLKGGGDLDFCWRLQETGNRLEYQLSGKVLRRPRNRFTPFLDRCIYEGALEPFLQKMHPKRVKHMIASWTAIGFWLLFLMTLVGRSAVPLALCLLLVAGESAVRFWGILVERIPINPLFLPLNILRGYGAFLYTTCRFISRYYLFLLFLLPFFFPLGFSLILLAHLVAGVTDYWRNQPYMGLFSFFFFYTSENLAYQAGVWWGCLNAANFKPVLPRLVFLDGPNLKAALWTDEDGPPPP